MKRIAACTSGLRERETCLMSIRSAVSVVGATDAVGVLCSVIIGVYLCLA